MALPSELFTIQSMLTLGGAVAATVVVCSGLQAAMNFNPRWLALLIALSLSLYGTLGRPNVVASDVIVAVLNGFLIYCTAVGANTLIAGGSHRGRRTARARDAGDSVYPQAPQARRGFSSPWF